MKSLLFKQSGRHYDLLAYLVNLFKLIFLTGKLCVILRKLLLLKRDFASYYNNRTLQNRFC